MTDKYLKFIKVSFAYETSSDFIIKEVSFHITNGWTGIVGANGAGKSTLLKLSAGLLTPTAGSVQHPKISEYCEQRTDNIPSNLALLLNDHSKPAFRIIDSLMIKDDWLQRWDTLSHGERKRAQIASALWTNPELLSIDEPTNHLDGQGRYLLFNSLKNFRGVGLLVSHDRELLDELCQKIIFVEDSSVKIKAGRFTAASQQYQLEKQSIISDYNRKKEEVLRIGNEVKNRLRIAEKIKNKSSKKHVGKKDHDAKARIDLGRVTGKDAVGGKLKRQLEGRLMQAESEFQKLSIPKERKHGIAIPSNSSEKNYLFKMDGTIKPLNDNKFIHIPDLIITPENRIALTGINGSGKSTLIKLIVLSLNLSPDRFVYIPQEISLDESHKIITRIKSLSNDQLGKLMIIISRLGSDAKRILETELLSPGETRKLLLASGMLNEPEFIIMDEPTNHMDLPSIECIENALREVKSSLLLVSHDVVFLTSLCNIFWEIRQTDEKNFCLTTK